MPQMRVVYLAWKRKYAAGQAFSTHRCGLLALKGIQNYWVPQTSSASNSSFAACSHLLVSGSVCVFPSFIFSKRVDQVESSTSNLLSFSASRSITLRAPRRAYVQWVRVALSVHYEFWGRRMLWHQAYLTFSLLCNTILPNLWLRYFPFYNYQNWFG